MERSDEDGIRKRKRDSKNRRRSSQASPQDTPPDDMSDTEGLLIAPKFPRRETENSTVDTNVVSQHDSSELAERMLRLLPHELRNRIYTYAVSVPWEKETICDGKLPLRLRSHCNTTQSHHSFWNPSPLHRYIDPHRFGAQIAHEMARVYYTINEFYFDYHELYLMHKFLTVDRFESGVRPADFVRSIEIVLDESFTCECNANALAFHGRLADGERSPVGAVRKCLEQLLGVTATSVKIRIIVYRKERRFPRLENQRELLRVLHPIVVALDRKGQLVVMEFHTSLGCEWSLRRSSGTSIDKLMRNKIEDN
ncbi:unnamed protein product [Periconia digitata]|uniref:Uncharacterized protein n=1 Tax=Periconia digitata TaxID=1303443 RepID=A0A9W4UAL5_9PLEO|nr:unnamed protein product [Periconia digitata]